MLYLDFIQRHILPIEHNNGEAYHLALSKTVAEKDFMQRIMEDIENNLLPQIKNQIFDGVEDIKMPLRDRCTNYLKSNGHYE